MRILFYDDVARESYDPAIMESSGLGGTESTVVRIAQELSLTHDVVVAQGARTTPLKLHSSLHFLPSRELEPFSGRQPDWVIVLRKHRLIKQLRQRFPSSRLALWIHNWQRREVLAWRAEIAKQRCQIIAASDAHRDHTNLLVNGTTARLLGKLLGNGEIIEIHRIYNPVNPHLRADDTSYNPDKLIFFSTANKGLNQVLDTFTRIREALPNLRLCIAGSTKETLFNYSELDHSQLEQPGVEILGRLPQQEVLKHVRESLCAFYPQNRHAETFGLIYAESNAVGTPVIAHNFGSAKEVLSSSEQLVDCTDTGELINRLREWRHSNRPNVFLRDEFTLSNVIEAWERFLVSSTITR